MHRVLLLAAAAATASAFVAPMGPRRRAVMLANAKEAYFEKLRTTKSDVGGDINRKADEETEKVFFLQRSPVAKALGFKPTDTPEFNKMKNDYAVYIEEFKQDRCVRVRAVTAAVVGQLCRRRRTLCARRVVVVAASRAAVARSAAAAHASASPAHPPP